MKHAVVPHRHTTAIDTRREIAAGASGLHGPRCFVGSSLAGDMIGATAWAWEAGAAWAGGGMYSTSANAVRLRYTTYPAAARVTTPTDKAWAGLSSDADMADRNDYVSLSRNYTHSLNVAVVCSSSQKDTMDPAVHQVTARTGMVAIPALPAVASHMRRLLSFREPGAGPKAKANVVELFTENVDANTMEIPIVTAVAQREFLRRHRIAVQIQTKPAAMGDAVEEFYDGLRDGQREFIAKAQQTLRERHGGILSAATAWGKTETMLMLARLHGQRTAVLCPNLSVIGVWRERLQRRMPSARVGIVQAQKCVTQDTDFVLISVQTLKENVEKFQLDPGLRGVGMVLIDETHLRPKQVFAALAALPAAPRISMSGTVKKLFGNQHEMLYAFIGNIISDVGVYSQPNTLFIFYSKYGRVENEERAHDDFMRHESVEVPPYDQFRRCRFYNACAEDVTRNVVACDAFCECLASLPSKARGLLLTERSDKIPHSRYLAGGVARRMGLNCIDDLPRGHEHEVDPNGVALLSNILKGKHGEAVRDAVMGPSGSKVISSSTKSLGTAVDINNLYVLLLAISVADARQFLGRVGRGDGVDHDNVWFIFIVDADDPHGWGPAKEIVKEIMWRRCRVQCRTAHHGPTRHRDFRAFSAERGKARVGADDAERAAEEQKQAHPRSATAAAALEMFRRPDKMAKLLAK
jgi:hypothetical protein